MRWVLDEQHVEDDEESVEKDGGMGNEVEREQTKTGVSGLSDAPLITWNSAGELIFFAFPLSVTNSHIRYLVGRYPVARHVSKLIHNWSSSFSRVLACFHSFFFENFLFWNCIAINRRLETTITRSSSPTLMPPLWHAYSQSRHPHLTWVIIQDRTHTHKNFSLQS